MKMLRFLVAMLVVTVAGAGVVGSASAAEKASRKASSPVMEQAAPAKGEKKASRKPAKKPPEMQPKSKGDKLPAVGKNAGSRGKAA